MINKKNLTIIFTLIIAIFSISHSVSADTYISHTCDDLGIVTATVSITPPGPFPMYYQSNFTATGYITSGCGPRNMKLTAKNSSDGIVATLIPQIGTEVLVNPGRYPNVGLNQAGFQSPAGTAGTFIVHFELGVDEPATITGVLLGAVNFQQLTSTLACSGAISTRAYYTAYNNYPIVGQMVYDNPGLTQPSGSNNLWTALVYSDNGVWDGYTRAGQTNSSGMLTALVNCP